MFKLCPCCGVDLVAIENAVKARIKFVENGGGAILCSDDRGSMERQKSVSPVANRAKDNSERVAPVKKRNRRGNVNAKDAAKIIGICESTLYRYRKAGIGPAYKAQGSRIWYKREDLMAFKRANKEASKAIALSERVKESSESNAQDF